MVGRGTESEEWDEALGLRSGLLLSPAALLLLLLLLSRRSLSLQLPEEEGRGATPTDMLMMFT